MLPELICGTPFHALPAPVPLEQPVPPGPAKLERDAFGDFNMVVTENFAVKYGPNFSQDRAERIAGWFEASWEAELNTLGHTHPVGSDTYLFNVYIGDTGGGIPSAAGNSGYFYVDNQNQPYIVYGRNTDEQTEFGEVTRKIDFSTSHAVVSAVACGSVTEKFTSWLKPRRISSCRVTGPAAAVPLGEPSRKDHSKAKDSPCSPSLKSTARECSAWPLVPLRRTRGQSGVGLGFADQSSISTIKKGWKAFCTQSISGDPQPLTPSTRRHASFGKAAT